jgi:outer membrane protein assembly factor BamA
MDTGNSLGLRAELRGTGANGSVQWADPAIFGSRNALGLGMALENFTFKDYTHDSAGLRGSLTRRINRRITAEIFSAFSLNTAESGVLTMDELGPDDYQTLTAGGRLILDYRDNPLTPRSGWLAGAAVEGGFDQGGANDINFLRTDFNASYYLPLGESWRFALGARWRTSRSTCGFLMAAAPRSAASRSAKWARFPPGVVRRWADSPPAWSMPSYPMKSSRTWRSPLLLMPAA